jgi:phosphatidylglycerophosphate synthase
MISHAAIIDATGHDTRRPVDTEVAGLGLLERTLRLADVSDCERAVVVYRPDDRLAVEQVRDRLNRDERYPMGVELVEAEGGRAIYDLVSERLDGRLRPETTLLALDSTHVYERGLVQDFAERTAATTGLLAHGATDSGHPALAALDGRSWTRLGEVTAEDTTRLVDSLVERTRTTSAVQSHGLETDGGWIEAITGTEAAQRAAERIWQGCIKSIDGPVSKNLNRPVSLAVSRWLAPTNVTPNHMSAVTFAVGLGATFAAATGGYWWFLLAAILYQISSILDGVDGELARGKYEFSVTGEWVDTLGDSFKDIFFYLGVGYGAYQTVPLDFAGLSSEAWLWAAGLAAAGKFVTVATTAVWLIPRGRGCALLFDWGGEEEPDEQESYDSTVAWVYNNLEVLGKNDVVLFLALVAAIPGLLPVYLVAVAIAHPLVAGGAIARLTSPEVDIFPEQTEQPESSESLA